MRSMSDPESTFLRAKSVVSRLVEAGHSAYYVGGSVRDRIMGREPSDIDIATSATPEEISRLFERTVPVGERFGVVLVVQEGQPFEVATFRTEGPYRDGRRPDWVSYADARADVARRDFTLNGLLHDPLRDEILDWVGGREDIRLKRVRSIGEPEERFAEDKLRLLRAVRFAANLGFDIEEATGKALREMAPEIRGVSAERVREELVKIFTGPHPDRGLLLLDDYGLLAHILPEMESMKGLDQGPEHPEGDVFAHTVKMLALMSQPTVSLAFAVLLHDVGKPATHDREGPALFPNHAKVGAEMARDIMIRLRFDRKTRERVAESVANHLRFLDVRRMRPSTLRRFLARDHIEEETELHRLDALASNGDLTNWSFIRERLEELRKEPLPEPPMIRGRDLLRLGLQPGPEIGRILAEVEEMRLAGTLKTSEEAESWVKEHYSRK